MLTLSSIFRLLPIFLAVIAVILCARRFHDDRRKHDRRIMVLSTIVAILLIIAQTSWWASSIIEGSQVSTWFARIIWNVYDTIVAIMLIMLAYRPKL